MCEAEKSEPSLLGSRGGIVPPPPGAMGCPQRSVTVRVEVDLKKSHLKLPGKTTQVCMSAARTAHVAAAAPGAWPPLHLHNVKPHRAAADGLHRGGKLQLLQFQVFLKTTWSWSVYSDMQWAIHSSKQHFNLSFLSLNSFIVDVNTKRNLNYFYCVNFSNDYLLLQLHTLLSGPISWQYLSLLSWKNLLLTHHLNDSFEISSVMLPNWLWLYSVNAGLHIQLSKKHLQRAEVWHTDQAQHHLQPHFGKHQVVSL